MIDLGPRYTLQNFFAIGNWSRYEPTLLCLAQHVIIIDVNDINKQAADAVIIQAMMEKMEEPIRCKHTFILISGDSDFSDTVKVAQSRGHQVLLIHGEYYRTSKKLLQIVDHHSSFNELCRRKRRSEEERLGGSCSRRMTL